MAELERSAVGGPGELAARVAVLERTVREAAFGAFGGVPGGGNGGVAEQAGGLQSALSGHAPRRRAAAMAPALPPPRAAHEVVVESEAQPARKRSRAADADARRVAAREESPAAPQRRRLPSPVSPLPPRRADEQQPPLAEPSLPRAAPPGAPRAATKAPVGRPRKAPAAKAPPAAPVAGDVELGRAAAVALGGRPGATVVTAAQAEPQGPEAVAAEVEAAAARATSEAAVRAVLLRAAAPNAPPHAAVAAARALCASAAMRTLSPPALLHGVVAALRSEAGSVPAASLHTRLAAAVVALDASLAQAHVAGSSARAAPARLLGGGACGGFLDAVQGELEQLLGEAAGGGPPAQAEVLSSAAFSLLRARLASARARVLLLDLLVHGSQTGGQHSPLAAVALGALRAWPSLLELPADDLLAAAAAAALGELLRDAPSLPAALLEASVEGVTERLLSVLSLLAEGEPGPELLHSAVRGLELLARHCGWAWARQRLLPCLACVLADQSRPDAAAAAARVLAPLLLVGLWEGDASAGLGEARRVLCDVLAAPHFDAATCAAAEAAAEVHARSALAETLEREAVSRWWGALTGEQQQQAPARLARSLRAIGLRPRTS